MKNKIIRTKLVDKKVYVKWYNIAKNVIKDENLIPKRTDKEIYKLVSRENWLIFASSGQNKDMAINSENPNVFLDILSKEGNLTGEARLGLTFNNLKSYDKFKTIMKGYNKNIKENVTKNLLRLGGTWKISISRKVKNHNWAQTPEYSRVAEWNSNQISEDIIDKIIEIGNNIKEKGREIAKEKKSQNKFYRETPSINLMDMVFPLNLEEFSMRILEIFGVLALCLNVKTEIERNKIMKEKEKKLKEKKKDLEIAHKHECELKVLSEISPSKVSEKQKIENKGEIKRLENGIKKLEEELKILE